MYILCVCIYIKLITLLSSRTAPPRVVTMSSDSDKDEEDEEEEPGRRNTVTAKIVEEDTGLVIS